jgi:deazaflavin-dependent oxidoreductase (nitroreductase family)
LTRESNIFTRSPTGGRVLSALTLPRFTIHPPVGYGVLTTIGRRTGKTRRRCMHVARHGNRAYIVILRASPIAREMGWIAGWLWNIRSNPNVRLRIRDGKIRSTTFRARARELTDAEELRVARAIYCDTVNPLDRAEYVFHRGQRPTRARIEALHRQWFDSGIPIAIEWGDGAGG